VVDHAKSTHQVFVDVVSIVPRTYWDNKPTERIWNHSFYGYLRVYIENLLKLAWNMKFPDQDQRGLIEMFKEVVDVENVLSKDISDGLHLMNIIDRFGYEPVSVSSTSQGMPGIVTGR